MRRKTFNLSVLKYISVLLALAIMIPVAPRPVFAAAELFVSTSGNDNNPCTVAAPCATIQRAVTLASNGSIIRVAKGTYSPTGISCPNQNAPAGVCINNINLSLYGGYDSSWNTRDLSPTGGTIIKAHSGIRGVSIQNSRVIFDGFTIRDAVINEGDSFGAGMRVDILPVTLRNVHFIANISQGRDGGSIGGSGSGGGLAIMFTYDNGTNILDAVTFEGNKAIGGSGTTRGGVALGGGFYLIYAKIDATNTVYSNNIAQAGSSGGIGKDSNGLHADALGGGVAVQTGCEGSFTNITATGNKALGGTAGQEGGHGIGGGLHLESSSITVSNGLVQNNQAVGGTGTYNVGGMGGGGGLMTDAMSATLNKLTIVGNVARVGSGSKLGPAGGGALYLAFFGTGQNFNVDVNNTIIANNTSDANVPGASYSGGGGGGVQVQGVTANLTHVTFAQNSLRNLMVGLAFLVQASQGSTGVPGVLNLQNSIISDHTVGLNNQNTVTMSVTVGSRATLSSVMFYNNPFKEWNYNGYPVPNGTLTVTNRIDSTGPLNYVSAGSPNYNYHLKDNSPAIDRVANILTMDIDGDTRPTNSTSDLGADEFSIPTLTTATSNMMFIVDNQKVSKEVIVNVTGLSAPVTWQASSQTGIFLGESGNSLSTSGISGESLRIWVDPAYFNMGMTSRSITLSSETAQWYTLTITVLKVAQVEFVYLPILQR